MLPEKRSDIWEQLWGLGPSLRTLFLLEWTKEVEVLFAFTVLVLLCMLYSWAIQQVDFSLQDNSNISEVICPQEEAIRYKFLPALTGQSAFNDVE